MFSNYDWVLQAWCNVSGAQMGATGLKKNNKKTKHIISKDPDGKLRVQPSQMKHYHGAQGRNLVPTAAVRDPGDLHRLSLGAY